jgi:hypothetical protein
VFLTILKWIAVVGLLLGVVYLPFRYVDNVRMEAYDAGYDAAQVLCDKRMATLNQIHADSVLATVEEESKKTNSLATDLTKQRIAAKTLKDKLDAALKNQPEATGCVLNDDVTDLLRFSANGDSAAANQQADTLSKPSIDEMSRGATVPGGGHNANFKGTSSDLPRWLGSVS